ncbi:hypothetical protein Tco_0559505 [Tanacetum coccineum]
MLAEITVSRPVGSVKPTSRNHEIQAGTISLPAIEGVQREQGHMIVGVELAVIALTKRIAELDRDNRRLRGTVSVERGRERRKWNGGKEEIELEEMDNGENGENKNGNTNRNHGMNYGENISVEAACAIDLGSTDELLTENGPLMKEDIVGKDDWRVLAARSAENKKRWKVQLRDNRGQQPPFKRQNTRGSSWKSTGYYLLWSVGRLGHFQEGLSLVEESETVENRQLETRMENKLETRLEVTKRMAKLRHCRRTADGRISETNIVLKGCTLGLLGHPFNIDLMPIELGSFDVDHWYGLCLAEVHELIGCDERLFVFLLIAEDKSEEEVIEMCQSYENFQKVFPEDFPGLPPARQVEFQIDLVPGAAPVA